MAEGIVDLVPRLESHGDLFLFDCLLRGPIERGSTDTQRTSGLAFRVGPIGYAQLMSHFHQLARPYFPPNSREAFFKISFCTVSSPMIFLRSSGASPGSYPWLIAFWAGLRLSVNKPGAFSWNSCRHRVN